MLSFGDVVGIIVIMFFWFLFMWTFRFLALIVPVAIIRNIVQPKVEKVYKKFFPDEDGDYA